MSDNRVTGEEIWHTPLTGIDVGGAKIDGALVQKKLGVRENRRGKIRKVDKIGLR